MTHISTPADTRPHSDRFRCGGRESNFLATMKRLLTMMIVAYNPVTQSPLAAQEKSTGMGEAGKSATRAAPAAVAPLRIGSRRELFTDRFLIEDMKGTELRLHSPQRKETAIVFDQPWEGAHSGYVRVLEDKDHPKDSPQFLMYYRGWPSWFDKDGKAIRGSEVTCVARSEDGIRWIKPSLTLYEFTDQKSGSRFRTNNIVLPPDDPAASHNFTPFIDTRPGVPASERFKALTGSFKDGRPFWGYVSGDGIHWRKISKEPLLNKKNWPLRSDGTNIPCFWSDSDKCYYAYFRIWIDHNKQPMAAPGAGNDEKGWRWFGRARSEDFIHWKDVEPISVDGPVVEHLYTSEVQPYFRAPHLRLSFPCRMVYRKALSDAELDKFKVGPDNRQNVNDGAFMTSRDGLHFERTFMESFLRPGLDRRSWSGRNNYAACGVLSTGPEELSLYYDQGNDQLTEPSRKHLVRCTLRTDGFVSVHAPYRGGELLTKPLIFEGKSLEINYATSALGEVRIEVQSGEGRPIEGFTLSQCDAIFGDQISRTVTWGGNADVSKISGKPIKLRFVLKDVDLYSFRFGQ